jgi:hypothetical protein
MSRCGSNTGIGFVASFEYYADISGGVQQRYNEGWIRGHRYHAMQNC